MPVASGNKSAAKILVSVNTKIVNIPDQGGGSSVVTPIKYGFWTNVDDSKASELGHYPRY
jgi:hypothetical protein